MKENMRAILGILIMLAGVALGIYLWVFWGLLGGIVSFIEGAKATPIDSWGIATGIVRVFVGGAVGVVCGVPFVYLGASVMKSRPRITVRRVR